MNEQFYDGMADHFHLIFEDWDASMQRQGAAIAKLLPPPDEVGLILDVACGIGTQSLALAAIGYSVEGSDISAVEIARAQREAASRGLKCSFRVDDMRTLKTASVARYGAIIAMDNALPHLDSDDTFSRPSLPCDRAYDPAARCSSAFVITLGICKNGMHACRPPSTATTDSDGSSSRFGIGLMIAATLFIYT
jgi:SAM-dependent methyltransferase